MELDLINNDSENIVSDQDNFTDNLLSDEASSEDFLADSQELVITDLSINNFSELEYISLGFENVNAKLDSINNQLALTNGLLIFCCVYILIAILYKFFNSFFNMA